MNVYRRQARTWPELMIQRIRQGTRFLHVLLIILSVVGGVTFGEFILEEAAQQATFGCFILNTAQEYRLMWHCAHRVEGIASVLDKFNSIVGWINPFTYLSYREYVQSAYQYAISLKFAACSRVDMEVCNAQQEQE